MIPAMQTRGRLVERAHGLTPREMEIVREVFKGRTDIEIGQTLGISPHTVRSHLSGIFNVTGCHSRVALIGWAYKEGLI